ncbi:MAG TPA: VOC family protein [Actinomycetes bacterium]|jgi:catechol 2,3-dioxygenase-like lactoylglutathione lyase family enzyme|nr:VOC family protein [Actinomycetes bacterium]
MTVTALWIPLEVPDAAGFRASARFYRDLLGLIEVDGWERDGEHGAVYAAGETGRIEIVRPAPDQAEAPGEHPNIAPMPPIAPIAFELPDRVAVDQLFDRLRASHPAAPGAAIPPTTFTRGHYAFSTADPAGYPILLWTEARR